MKNLKRVAGILLTLVLVLSLVPAAVWADPAADAEITVTFVNGGTVTVPAKPVTVKDTDGDGTLTIGEAFDALHKAYYTGGDEVPYMAESGFVNKFWGIETSAVGFYNNGAYSTGAGDPVKAGDYLTVYIYKDQATWSDSFSKFDKSAYTAETSTTVTLSNVTGYDSNYMPVFSPAAGASISVYDQSYNAVAADVYSVKDNNDGTYTVSFNKSGKYLIQADKTDANLVPALAMADVTIPAVTASVDFTAQLSGAYLFAPQFGVSVSSDLAENYGFADSVSGGVSVLDVLVKAHELAFGDAFTAATAADYLAIGPYGSPSVQFAVDSSDYYGGFSLNHAMANDGTKWDESNYNATTVATQAVKDGDLVEFFFYEDPNYGDSFNWFTDADGNYSRAFTVNENTDLTLKLKGFYAMSSSVFKDEAEMVASEKCFDGSDYQLGVVDLKTGAITDLDGAVTDEDGCVTLNFEDPGTYVICACNTDDSIFPLILSMTTIEVKDIPAAEDAVISATISVAGEVKVPVKEVTVKDLNSDGKLTVDEALYAAHEAYYSGGAAAGYASANTPWGLSVTKLWGDGSGNYGYYNNGQMCWGLEDPIAEGDYLAAFVYKDGKYWSDSFSKFDALTYSGGESVNVSLLNVTGFDENYLPVFEALSGASITVYASDYTAVDASKYAVTDNGDGSYAVSLTEGGNYIIQADKADPFIVPALAKAEVGLAASDKNGNTVFVTFTDDQNPPAELSTEEAAKIINDIAKANATETTADDIDTPPTVNDDDIAETAASVLTVIKQIEVTAPTGASFPLTITFDVPEVEAGQTIFAYHYNAATAKWELVGTGSGKSVTATFDSLSPVAIVAAALPPATGDAGVMPWIMLSMAAVMVAAVTVLYGRKRREE